MYKKKTKKKDISNTNRLNKSKNRCEYIYFSNEVGKPSIPTKHKQTTTYPYNK